MLRTGGQCCWRKPAVPPGRAMLKDVILIQYSDLHGFPPVLGCGQAAETTPTIRRAKSEFASSLSWIHLLANPGRFVRSIARKNHAQRAEISDQKALKYRDMRRAAKIIIQDYLLSRAACLRKAHPSRRAESPGASLAAPPHISILQAF